MEIYSVLDHELPAPQREHYLDLNADVAPAQFGYAKMSCCLTLDELCDRLEMEVAALKERIITAEVYECARFMLPLWVARRVRGNHAFVVLQTQNYWWSVEKVNGVMVIQRARDFTNVHSRCRGLYRWQTRWWWGSSPIQRVRDLAFTGDMGGARGLSIRTIIHSLIHERLFDVTGQTSEREATHVVDHIMGLCRKRLAALYAKYSYDRLS